MSLLTVDRVTVAFGGLTALRDVSFDVLPGEIRGVIGPNGAGKSTLLDVITGLTQPRRGRVLLDGNDLVAQRPDRVARAGVARTFQSVQLFRGMTVLENVMTGLHVTSGPSVVGALVGGARLRRAEGQMRAAAMEMLRFVGMEAFADREAGELSYGQQRLVEIARALVRKPRLLLLDEPAAGLSLVRVGEIDELLRRIRSETGTTILLVEHVIRLVMGISDRITVLNYGEKIAEDTPDAVRRDPRVIEAYLGSEAIGADAH